MASYLCCKKWLVLLVQSHSVHQCSRLNHNKPLPSNSCFYINNEAFHFGFLNDLIKEMVRHIMINMSSLNFGIYYLLNISSGQNIAWINIITNTSFVNHKFKKHNQLTDLEKNGSEQHQDLWKMLPLYLCNSK